MRKMWGECGVEGRSRTEYVVEKRKGGGDELCGFQGVVVEGMKPY